jgi:drug/metabolite transporter (DMT)-like permease
MTPEATTHSRHRAAGTAAVAAAMALFGVNNVLVRQMTVTGLATATWRLWLGTAAMLVALRVAGRRLSWGGLRTAVPGGIAYGASIWLFFAAFKATSITNASLISALQSGLTLTVVGRLFGERVRGADIALTGVATAGVALVIVGAGEGGTASLRGDLLAAGGVLASTVYFVAAKQARRSEPAAEYQAGLLVVSAVATTVVMFAGRQGLGHPTGADWARLAVLSVGGSAGHLGINWAHRHVPLVTSSLLTLAVPVVASATAWAVLDERITPLQWLGALVTLGALALVILRAVRGEAPEPVG